MEIEELKKVAYKKKKDLPRYATYITHKISIRIVNILKDYPIKPDWVTGFTIFLGVISALLFCFANKYSILIAAIFLEIYYIFDAVDGQLARVKGQSSLTGAFFDYISNHIVHSLVFLGIGYGLFHRSGNILYFISGAFAAWGMVFMYTIYDARYNVLFHSKGGNANVEKTIATEIVGHKTSFLKRIFMLLHQMCRYPTIMNIITTFAVLNFLLTKFSISKKPVLFKALIIFYAVAINVVWISKLFRAITKKELD